MKLRFNEGAPQCKLMTRKDSEKDSERPHYYSQFWLDVAAGRKIIGAPRSNDETDIEPEPELEPEPITLRKTGRSSETALSDGYEGTISHPEVEPELEAEEYVEPELDEVEVENNVEETDIPNMLVEETEIPDVDLAPLEEEEEFFDGEEEEEEDLEWGSGRGRKKPKPGRQQKQPKKIKRDRRGF